MIKLDDYYGFQLTILLGNDAVQTADDVAGLLEKTAKRIRQGSDYGKIMDINGNSVGQFEFMKGGR